MHTLGVIVNPAKPASLAILPRLAAEAKRLGLDLVACQPDLAGQSGLVSVESGNLCDKVQAIVALGGDGTLLKAAHLMRHSSPPVLGVNLGQVGFLTSVTENELEKGLQALVSGQYTTSERKMLDGTILSGGRTARGSIRALNDIVIGWGQSTRIVTLDVAVNGEPVTSYRCDGIIVSTPTGSTGHSLSAGGPILHPDAASLVLNVICPHTLSARPLVVPDSVEIRITVRQTSKQLLLSYDGQDGESLADGDALVVRKAPVKFPLVHLPGYQYFSVLRKKLQWSGSSA